MKQSPWIEIMLLDYTADGYATITLLPPANEVWGQVIFLHQFVILFTGGGACVVDRGACVVSWGGMHGWQGGVHGWQGESMLGGCMVAGGMHGCWGACVAKGGVHGEGGMHGKGGHAW